MPIDLSLTHEGSMSLPESKTREYKQDLSSPARAMRSLVAFANSAGGQLVVGVHDDLHVVGVADPLNEEERLANLIADWIEPRLVPTIELSTVNGKSVLVANVAVSGRRPHHIKTEGPEAGVYVRLGNTNRQADPALIAELKRGTRSEFFDKLPVPTMTVDDLDTEALSTMLKRDVDENVLRTLSLVTRDQGRLVPTNGGLLLAGKHREETFPFAWAQCGRFWSPERLDFSDRIEIRTHLPLMVDEIMAFLTKHAFKSAEFGDIRRKDVYSIPVEALREIIINAIVHASYSGARSPIRVAFMDDRIEVDNPGGLMPGLTIDDIMTGVSEIRNPVLARVFSEMDLMEEWGTGLRRAVRSLGESGLPAPEFIELPGRLRVIVHIANHQPTIAVTSKPALSSNQESEHVDDTSEHVSEHVHGQSEHVSEHVDLELGPHAITLLTTATDSPARREDLLGAAGLTNAYGNYKRNLIPLLDAGLLERTEPDSPRSTTQRYQLTEQGRLYLEQASPIRTVPGDADTEGADIHPAI
ncbi:MAG: helix-turn-helix domain-containing protein [Propionibacteriaceae bacterium]|jgi:predicted HTH transcriptional regulator|nr:helix-turn-helix domain-containing protein [Propionibacteriaceae bacterium]